MPMPPRLWSHLETAEFLGIPPATLHGLNYKGTGPRSFKVGRYRRYDPRDVMEWLEGRASERGNGGYTASTSPARSGRRSGGRGSSRRGHVS